MFTFPPGHQHEPLNYSCTLPSQYGLCESPYGFSFHSIFITPRPALKKTKNKNPGNYIFLQYGTFKYVMNGSLTN